MISLSIIIVNYDVCILHLHILTIRINNEKKITYFISFLKLFIYLFIFDRNFNLNSHTCIFWGSRESNPCPHRGVRLFGKGDYILDLLASK